MAVGLAVGFACLAKSPAFWWCCPVLWVWDPTTSSMWERKSFHSVSSFLFLLGLIANVGVSFKEWVTWTDTVISSCSGRWTPSWLVWSPGEFQCIVIGLEYSCVLLIKGKILTLETTMEHSLFVHKEVETWIIDNCSNYCWVSNCHLGIMRQSCLQFDSNILLLPFFPNP